MSREEMERKIAEFHSRLGQLIEKNPNLNPEGPEIKALIKEFNDMGVPIQIVRKEDMVKAAMNMLGIEMPTDDIHASRNTESLDNNLNPCKYHKKGLDDSKLNREICKSDVDNLTIDLNTKSDEEIWKMFS